MQKHNATAQALFSTVGSRDILALAKQARKEARLRRRKEWKDENTPENTLPQVQTEKH